MTEENNLKYWRTRKADVGFTIKKKKSAKRNWQWLCPVTASDGLMLAITHPRWLNTWAVTWTAQDMDIRTHHMQVPLPGTLHTSPHLLFPRELTGFSQQSCRWGKEKSLTRVGTLPKVTQLANDRVETTQICLKPEQYSTRLFPRCLF